MYKEPISKSLKTFVDLAGDSRWQIKGLIKQAILAGKFRTIANSEAVYYGDLLIGSTLASACEYLLLDAQGVLLRENIKRELANT